MSQINFLLFDKVLSIAAYEFLLSDTWLLEYVLYDVQYDIPRSCSGLCLLPKFVFCACAIFFEMNFLQRYFC